MKKFYICFFLLLIISISAFKLQEDFPHVLIQKNYENRIAEFQKQLELTSKLANNLDKGNITNFRQQFFKTRLAFKKCEYLLEVLNPIICKEYINGSPLPKLEKESFGLNIIQPKGLQILDELIFSDEILFEKKHISELLEELSSIIKNLSFTNKIYDRQVFEGMRLELVRIFTLGLTGFDVPASGGSIKEANFALNSMLEDIKPYLKLVKNEDLIFTIEQHFMELQTYLSENDNFDKLNRLEILTKYINPLYANIYDLQLALSIESSSESLAENLLPPINLNSRNIFSSNFLDAFRYIGLPRTLYKDSMVQLGKLLFYDPILSANNERSCASCHNPQKGFTDGYSKSIATGMNGFVERNSPTLLNCVYSERFFADLRADALEDQMDHVIASSKEFNTTTLEITEKLSKSSEYVNWFTKCFPTYYVNPINKHTLSFAISAFVSSLQSFNSPFDQYVRGERKEISNAIKNGFNIFMGKGACGTCHFAPVFNGTVPPFYQESESEVLGVPENPSAKKVILDPDKGRYNGKLKEAAPFYKHSFKTPTIRNIALTAPYMHNGSYKTLKQVMDFYNKGGGIGLGIEVPYQTLPSDKLNLSKTEINDVIAFMQSLTDTTNLTNVPVSLPQFNNEKLWNNRKVGGVY